MDVASEAKRRAYVGWLRTGRWPVPRGADGTEWKFNPWHDPKDGRFTTAKRWRRCGQLSAICKRKNRVAITQWGFEFGDRYLGRSAILGEGSSDYRQSRV